MVSIRDQNNQYLSFEGSLLTLSALKTELVVGSKSLNRNILAKTKLNDNIKSAFLNGIDSRGFLQLKLTYFAEAPVYIDIIPILIPTNGHLFQTEF